jgi:hypothetical protein
LLDQTSCSRLFLHIIQQAPRFNQRDSACPTPSELASTHDCSWWLLFRGSLIYPLPLSRPPLAEHCVLFAVFFFADPCHHGLGTKVRGQRHRRASRWFFCTTHLPAACVASLCDSFYPRGSDGACRFFRRSRSPLLGSCCRHLVRAWKDWQYLGRDFWFLAKQDPAFVEKLVGHAC